MNIKIEFLMKLLPRTFKQPYLCKLKSPNDCQCVLTTIQKEFDLCMKNCSIDPLRLVRLDF